MSRISFLVGYDRIAKSSAGIAAVELADIEVPKKQGRRILTKKAEENVVQFWDQTRLGLVQRMRYDGTMTAVIELVNPLKQMNLWNPNHLVPLNSLRTPQGWRQNCIKEKTE